MYFVWYLTSWCGICTVWYLTSRYSIFYCLWGITNMFGLPSYTVRKKKKKIERLMNICWCGGVKVIFPWHLNENWLTLHPINKYSMKFQFIKFFLSVFRHVSWIPSWVISTDCSQCKVRNVFSNLFCLLSKLLEYTMECIEHKANNRAKTVT